jgi:hypothetical protein
MKTSILLAGAALVALASGPDAARAATPAIVYSGGSTLAAKVYRDIFNCYSTKANGVFSTSATYTSGFAIAYPTAENASCTKQGTANEVTLYEPVGSGAGQGAWEAANPNGNATLGYTSWGTPANTNTIAFLDTKAGVTTTPYPEIQFSGSDAYLNSTQVSNAETSVGETVFQLPIFATPITLPIGDPKQTASLTKVKLTTADVCNLFAGATNVTSGKVTISELVVRSDGSGTSFILSDWLAQNCSASLGFNSSNGFPSTKPSWAAVAAANGNHLGTPVAVSGSGGIASTVASTQAALGYDSPDYVYPIVTNSTAYPAMVNGQSPSVTATKTHLVHASYPSSYNVLTIGQQVNDSLVAPGNTSGYPIVGYTFWETYSCYSTKIAGGLIGGPAQGKQVLDLATYFYNTSNTSISNILTSQGFVQAGTPILKLLKGTGGPLNASGGIQNSSCPAT